MHVFLVYSVLRPWVTFVARCMQKAERKTNRILIRENAALSVTWARLAEQKNRGEKVLCFSTPVELDGTMFFTLVELFRETYILSSHLVQRCKILILATVTEIPH